MSKIIAARYLGKSPVYNMEVVEHHNFITAMGTVLHNCDALRYFCISRTMPAVQETEKDRLLDEDDGENEEYDSYITGGEPSENYING